MPASSRNNTLARAGEFEEQYEGSFVVQVEVGGETKTLEFNSAFGSIYFGYGSYKKVEETEEPTQTTFPAELIGRPSRLNS